MEKDRFNNFMDKFIKLVENKGRSGFYGYNCVSSIEYLKQCFISLCCEDYIFITSKFYAEFFKNCGFNVHRTSFLSYMVERG